jgi:outer membrane protein, multidrug efflux system
MAEDDKSASKKTETRESPASFLTVLTAEKALFSAQDNHAQSEERVSTDLVALYKALGGGW